MITGAVTADREAVIRVAVRGVPGHPMELEAVIGSGFTGFLALPGQLIAELGLPFAGTTQAALANGNEVQMDVFEALVVWDGKDQGVPVLAAEGGTLVGMS